MRTGRISKKNPVLEIHTRNLYTKFSADWIIRNREIVYQKMSSSYIIIIIRDTLLSPTLGGFWAIFGKFQGPIKSEKKFAMRYFAACRSLGGKSIEAKIFWKAFTTTK